MECAYINTGCWADSHAFGKVCSLHRSRCSTAALWFDPQWATTSWTGSTFEASKKLLWIKLIFIIRVCVATLLHFTNAEREKWYSSLHSIHMGGKSHRADGFLGALPCATRVLACFLLYLICSSGCSLSIVSYNNFQRSCYLRGLGDYITIKQQWKDGIPQCFFFFIFGQFYIPAPPHGCHCCCND